MKKKIFFLLILFLFTKIANTQNIKGELISDSLNITIIKVWGTHYERGFAQGYLIGSKMIDIFENYIKPIFGQNLSTAKQFIANGEHIYIKDKYFDEAHGVEDGIIAAGYSKGSFDYLDVLAANSFLDYYGFLSKTDKNNINLGCSSLISWGDATQNTSLFGSTVVTRYVDWSQNKSIIDNQVAVIHIPSETDEQPWIMMGFAGQISALSGANSYGAAFMHALSDFSNTASLNCAYIPIWFAIREGLENIDFNNDSFNNTLDMISAITQNNNGFADGSIVSVAYENADNSDSLIAVIMEIANIKPYYTLRYSSYPDLIPSDNLYTANFQIARNNANHYCSRYYNVVNSIGQGIDIGDVDNWTILRDFSQGSVSSMQLMQYLPNSKIFKVAVTNTASYAYSNDSVVLNLFELFSSPNNQKINSKTSISVFPNPFYDFFVIENFENQIFTIEIYNLSGKMVYYQNTRSEQLIKVLISDLPLGVYIVRAITNSEVLATKILKNRF